MINKFNLVDMSLFMFVLEHYFFYASGHETAFIHIRWESGFHGFYGDNNNVLLRAIMAVLILINTYSGVFITCMFFLVLLRAQSDNTRVSVNIILKFCLFNSLKVFFGTQI